MQDLPDFLTHYTRAEPFRSLLECSPEERAALVQAFDAENTLAVQRFADAEAYLEHRARLERRMHAELLERGGRPQREHPYYLVLGRSAWFERHEGAGLRSYELPLVALDPAHLSFTYGDSGISYLLHDGTWPHAPAERYRRPHHGRLFLLEELSELIAASGFPDGSQPRDSDRRYDYYLEAQLWSEPPSGSA